MITAKNVKRHYLSMEFNKINNPDFNDEKTYPLSLMSSYGRTNLYTPQINNISLRTPNYPVLYEWDIVPRDDICNEVNASTSCKSNDPYCSCIYTYEFELNEVVEFVIADEGFTFQSNHPMHFHGHKYAVMGVDKVRTWTVLNFSLLIYERLCFELKSSTDQWVWKLLKRWISRAC